MVEIFYPRRNRMASPDHGRLVGEVAQEIAEFQAATDLVDEAVAARLGVNRTDLRCLGLLSLDGPLTAGQLAQASGLSPGATTTALDRLERAGHARRVRDVADRRSVLVELTPTAQQQLEECYGPIGREGQERLARYSDAELSFLRAFLEEVRAFQERHAARLRHEGNSPTASSRQ